MVVYGNTTKHIDPNKRPPNLDKDHTHQWTLFVKGVDDEDISYWLKKVQFKLHDSYHNSLRSKQIPSLVPRRFSDMIPSTAVEQPPFEVHETGWGEFDVMIKLFFVSESGEKPQSLWHTLKIHPYGPDAEIQRIEKRPIVSEAYEEVVFNEPVEQFYEILTGGPEKGAKGKATGKSGAKQASRNQEGRTAEVPQRETRDNQYSKELESKQLDIMKEALRKVDGMIAKEKEKLSGKEVMLDSLRRVEGVVPKKK